MTSISQMLHQRTKSPPLFFFLLSLIPQKLCFWQPASIPPGPHNQRSPVTVQETRCFPGTTMGYTLGRGEAGKHRPPLSFSMVHCPSPSPPRSREQVPWRSKGRALLGAYPPGDRWGRGAMLTSWHSRTALASAPARTGAAPPGTLRIAL